MAKHSLTFPDEGKHHDDVASDAPKEEPSITLEAENSEPSSVPSDNDGKRKSGKDSTKTSRVDADKKVSAGKHTTSSIEEMDTKAASGKHAPGSHFPSFLKGSHADEKSTYSADTDKYASRAREARFRKTSILISACVALVGSIIGVGLIVASHFIDAPESQTDESDDAIVITSPGFSAPLPADDDESGIEESTVLLPEQTDQVIGVQQPAESDAPEGSVEAGLDQFGSFQVTAEDLGSLPAQEEPFAFALDEEDASAPELSTESQRAIEEAIANASQDEALVSCILVDLNSGRGIAANLDAQPYGASSFKGLFGAYLCEETDFGIMDAYDAWDRIEASVVSSDNDSYDSLRSQYESEHLKEWLDSAGVPDDEQLYRDWYPFQSARESSMMWLHVNEYLATGTDNAERIGEMLQSTNVSFIRNVIGSEDITVRNKGGWYAATWDDDPRWNGTCDAGIITCNGHTYLMSVMTGQPACDAAVENVEALARTLWDARADLAATPEEN